MDKINKKLIKSFKEPSTLNQYIGCRVAIREIYEKEETNKTEFLINLRDFLLEYNKDIKKPECIICGGDLDNREACQNGCH